jgi:hypothetical protein
MLHESTNKHESTKARRYEGTNKQTITQINNKSTNQQISNFKKKCIFANLWEIYMIY